jgi:diguanylate cyclase (GGDEF)-like protein
LCLFYADLNDLKGINDRLGHEKGDEALLEAASLLREVFRESDILARMGGDEFAVLALDSSLEASRSFTDRLRRQLAARNASGRRDFILSMSVGMASFDPAKPLTLDGLVSLADARMYAQKRKRRSLSGDPR